MRETTVLSIMGYAVPFKYTVYEGGYIEWQTSLATNDSLLNTLLRIHYNEYICAELRKTWFEEEYEQSQLSSAQMSLGLADDTVF
jgi:hypothetical protein